MSGMRGGFAWLAAAALAATWPAAAETLEDAWRMALRQNQALAAAAADVEAARANESAARAARWPTVRASAAYTRLDQAPALAVSSPALEFRSPPIFAGDDFVMGSGEVTLPLYTGGQVRSGIRAASEALASATQDERSAIAALKLDTARAYVGVLRARKALRTSESRVASLAAHAADVEHMVERELVATSDLLAARVALANAEQERVRAANGLKVAEAAYNRWLGEPLDRDVDLDERIATDPALASEAIDGLVKEALDSRSEIKSAAARAQALESQSRAEVGKLLPQLALTGSYTYFENEILDRQNAAAVGIGIEWNLFDGGQTRSRAAALRGAGRAAERRAADLRSQIELEVRAAVLDVGAARARLAAMHEAVAQAEENLRTSRELYGAGLATNTQVLDAVALRVSAINNHDDAELDEVLAQLRLAYAVGRL